MSQYAFRTEGVPPKATAAVTPVPTTNTIASSWGIVRVVGAPGTLRVPSPAPCTSEGDLGVWNRQAKGSANSPDYILPSIYVAAPTPQTVPHDIANEIPIPAISTHQPTAPFSASARNRAVAVSSIAQRRPKIGGRKVTPWPKVVPQWPSVTG